ncbi:hypothetical protein ACFFRR_001665 [Megaselia abdita]
MFEYLKTPPPRSKRAFTELEMMNELMVFRMENDIQFVSQPHPILVAVGSNKKCVSKYQLHLEYMTMDLPTNSNFLSALALWLESFYVFNISFPPTLREFWQFLMIHVLE